MSAVKRERWVQAGPREPPCVARTRMMSARLRGAQRVSNGSQACSRIPKCAHKWEKVGVEDDDGPSSPDRYHLRQWVMNTSTCFDHCPLLGGGRHPAPKRSSTRLSLFLQKVLLCSPHDPPLRHRIRRLCVERILTRISREVSVRILVVAGLPSAEVLLQFH